MSKRKLKESEQKLEKELREISGSEIDAILNEIDENEKGKSDKSAAGTSQVSRHALANVTGKENGQEKEWLSSEVSFECLVSLKTVERKTEIETETGTDCGLIVTHRGKLSLMEASSFSSWLEWKSKCRLDEVVSKALLRVKGLTLKLGSMQLGQESVIFYTYAWYVYRYHCMCVCVCHVRFFLFNLHALAGAQFRIYKYILFFSSFDSCTKR